MVRLAGSLASLVLLVAHAATGGYGSIAAPSPLPTEVGNAACAACHRSIYDSYSLTAMARTSGPALPNLIEGSFDHAPSGVSYRVHRAGDVALLSYDRSGPQGLHGTQQLKYYVGSNSRGRTFLFDIDGFLYQSPINYYAAKRVWDMSPGYTQLREMELNHPVDATCLFCHASRVQPPIEGTVNRFAREPFLQPGVGCERCHGPGGDHVQGRGSMINPARLKAEPRDSVCAQCHLEGTARIAKVGRTPYSYRPGETLSESLAIFVRTDADAHGPGAVSQVESLALSRCKRTAGDALSCITCHDPHVQPTTAQKAGYYRAKCLGCHAALATDHHSRQQDCTACHMPRLDSADIGHTLVTDHRIVRARRNDRPSTSRPYTLAQFGTPTPNARDLGLAYGEVALNGDAFAAREALRLLEEALPTHQDDAEVLTRLGYLHQLRGDLDRAAAFYERALRHDPSRAVAAANLGVFFIGQGMSTRALALWRDAFDRNPQLTELGVNLGRALCGSGDVAGARQVAQRVLEHNPDAGAARQLLAMVTERNCTQR
jgi:Flp pilus assembly protein TadD